MKDKIEAILPDHNLLLSEAPELYIVDYKDINSGDVELLESEPADAKYVYLKNKQPIAIYFDGFKENALPVSVGVYNPQCECVLFPNSCKGSDWILFVETKYANNLQAAFREEYDYPRSAINQIIETVKYFRDRGIIEKNRRVTAIISFPNLIEAFNSFIFTEDLSEMDILLNHKILIRATNSALIKSEKRITLNAV